MKRSLLLIILACLTLSVWGQPPIVEIVIPVSGKLVFTNILDQYTGNSINQLFVLNTNNSDIEILETDKRLIGSPLWNATGNLLLFDNIQEQGGVTEFRILDTISQTSNQVWQENRALIADWNDTQIIYETLSVEEPRTNNLYHLDLTTNVILPMFSFTEGQTISGLPLPNLSSTSINSLLFERITDVDWNPVHDDWMLLEMRTRSNGSDMEVEAGISYTILFLYNVSTGEILSINELVGYRVVADAGWDVTGQYIALIDTQSISFTGMVIKFDAENHDLQIVEEAPVDRVFEHWLGVSDLFISIDTGRPDGYVVFHITQLGVNGVNKLEFLRLPRTTFVTPGGISEIDWIYLGDEEESAELSCIFDETLPTRLEIGGEAQVAFTDGTPSRLRSEPSTWGDVVQSLPEGTTFEIIGGYMCGSGYRWWQVQLADGTQGWIAEASETEYWIERRAS